MQAPKQLGRFAWRGAALSGVALQRRPLAALMTSPMNMHEIDQDTAEPPHTTHHVKLLPHPSPPSNQTNAPNILGFYSLFTSPNPPSILEVERTCSCRKRQKQQAPTPHKRQSVTAEREKSQTPKV